MADILNKSFSGSRTLLRSQLVRDREVQLAPNSNYYHTVNTEVHKSSCIEFSLQCGIEETRYETCEVKFLWKCHGVFFASLNSDFFCDIGSKYYCFIVKLGFKHTI